MDLHNLFRNNKVGLVLSGAGAKGSYQIGVLKALLEFDLLKYVSVLSGTSAGALNTLFYLYGDYRKAKNIWFSISNSSIYQIQFRNLKRGGLFSQREVKHQISNNINFEKIHQSNMKMYISYSTIDNRKRIIGRCICLNNSSRKKINETLHASISVPYLFEKYYINKELCIDGALNSNIPILPAYADGCNIILVIHFDKTNPIDRNLYPNAHIIEIISQKERKGFLNGIWNFNNTTIQELYYSGYVECKNVIENIYSDEIDIHTLINISKQQHDTSFKNFITLDRLANRLNEIIV